MIEQSLLLYGINIQQPEKFICINKKILLDPLEAVKHLKQEDGPYCTISGNEPSSVTPLQNWQRKSDIIAAISRIYICVV